jgi:hypothetical protein
MAARSRVIVHNDQLDSATVQAIAARLKSAASELEQAIGRSRP